MPKLLRRGPESGPGGRAPGRGGRGRAPASTERSRVGTWWITLPPRAARRVRGFYGEVPSRDLVAREDHRARHDHQASTERSRVGTWWYARPCPDCGTLMLLRRGPESGPGGTAVLLLPVPMSMLLRRGPESGPGGLHRVRRPRRPLHRFYGEVPSRDLVDLLAIERLAVRAASTERSRVGTWWVDRGDLVHRVVSASTERSRVGTWWLPGRRGSSSRRSKLLRRGPESGPGGGRPRAARVADRLASTERSRVGTWWSSHHLCPFCRQS